MIRVAFLLVLSTLLAACASKIKPAPEDIANYSKPVSAECAALGEPSRPGRPKFPLNAAQARQEGWVILGYGVEDGQVVRAHVIHASPPRVFDRFAMEMLASQRYAPGKNAQLCEQSINFAIAGELR